MNLLTKLLIIVRELAHKAVHSTQKIVYIHLCLRIIQVHEQFTNHRELLTNHCQLFANIRELGGNFFAKYRIYIGIKLMVKLLL